MENILRVYRERLMSALQDVSQYETKLRELGVWWGKIALLGKINSYNVAATILDDMEETKRKFGELQTKLIHHLMLEHLKKRTQDDSSTAQVAIDVLIRNLFERTADVGFLATDDDIRRFLNNPEPSEEQRLFIQNRLEEYVKKYSVYDEIIILSPQGEVRCHLNSENPIEYSHDPLIETTINTKGDYLETFRFSDLQPSNSRSLIYSCKITTDNEVGSPLLGVLCLCFRFDDEMEGIFANLLDQGDPRTIMLLDDKDTVIASSRPGLVSVGQTLEIHQSPSIKGYAGNDYLFNLMQTHGYQGFYGLGWRGLVMTPLKYLTGTQGADNGGVDDDLLENGKLFSDELKQIRRDSSLVNDDLGLVVLNGKITSARSEAQEFMPVLEAIKQIGTDISNIFSSSIKSLQETVISSRLSDVQFIAELAVDIMDRNLYERANDCRWWALTSAFRDILSKPSVDQHDQQMLHDILVYINDLYTVYSNLYIYNFQGEVVAVSNSEEESIIGTRLDDSSAAMQTFSLESTQDYTVSPFIPTPLYGNRHSYIYNAAIRDPADGQNIVGGIGIVFDSEPQFSEMLEDILPRDDKGEIINGAFALFCQRNGSIISVAHHPSMKVGDSVALPAEFLDLNSGECRSMCTDFEGQHYTLGMAASKGYREYKTTGDYCNDVIALVFVPL